MAKKDKTPATDNPATDTTAETPRELAFGEFKAAWDSIPEGNRIRLAQRSFAHIMANETAAAVTAHAKAATEKGETFGDAEKAVMLHDLRAKKLDLIVHGVLGTRVTGPRLVGIDAFIRDVVDEFLSTQAAAKKVAMPKGDALKEQRAAVLASAKRGPWARAEAQRRMDAQKDASDLLDE